MLTFFIFVALILLFYLLSKSSDLVVRHIQKIGTHFNIPILFLGFILGFLTSLPELSIAVSTATRSIQELSLGNLLGGIPVLFGLILGGSVLVHRTIRTDGKMSTILPILGFTFLPFLFGLTGEIGAIKGVLLILGYFGIMFLLFRERKLEDYKSIEKSERLPIARSIALVLLGIISLLVLSNIIVRLTETVLETYTIPVFFIGFILFSVGTNLPEIMITLSSWKKDAKELSLSNILGSAMANPLILGMLATFRPIPVENSFSYIFLVCLVLVLLFSVSRFYASEKKLTKKEGIVLLGLYCVLFVVEWIAA